jgi:thermitase
MQKKRSKSLLFIVIFLYLCFVSGSAETTVNNSNTTDSAPNQSLGGTPMIPLVNTPADLNISVDELSHGKNSISDVVSDTSTGRKFARNHIIVRFKPQNFANSSISTDNALNMNPNIKGKILNDFTRNGVSGLLIVELPNETSVQSALADYMANPDVLYAEPDYLISLSPRETDAIIQNVDQANGLLIPNDPNFSELWGLHNTGQTGGTPGADINATAAWDISTGSDAVTVAVVDTGVNYIHPDLSANIWTNPGELPGNGIDDDHNGYIDDIHGWNFVTNTSDPLDDNGHGTHVSGTIGALGNNGLGVAGVNWHIRIMPLKFLDASGSGFTSNAISAILYANGKNAAVISNSWAGSGFDQALKDAIDISPAVVVCAAGNFPDAPEINNDIVPLYPASLNSVNVISVAATDKNDQLASFSHYGPISVDLAAPGTSILSTYFDSGYTYMQGTSMATPHVSGTAALIKSVNPRLSNKQIRGIILNNVDVKSQLSGFINSSGRLNAYKAVLAGQRMAGTDRVGVYRSPGVWILDYNGNGVWDGTPADKILGFGASGDIPVTGDWNEDGKTEIGVYRSPGVWILDYNGNNVWEGTPTDRILGFGSEGDSPVKGKWN